MSGPIIPPISMLSGGSNGKVLLVIGVLCALVVAANQGKKPTVSPAAAVGSQS